MGVVEEAVVGGPHAPLGSHRAVPGQLVGGHQHLAVDDVTGELVDPLGRVVGRDPGVEAVVPAVHAADQVGALDAAVGEQGPAVRAAALEHVHLVAPADEDEVDPLGLGVRRCVLREVGEGRDGEVGAAGHG